MLLCSIAHSIICTRLFRGKMHSDWFNGIEILHDRWQHGEKVGYCYPRGLEKILCKWDIYVRTAGHERVKIFFFFTFAYFILSSNPLIYWQRARGGLYHFGIKISSKEWSSDHGRLAPSIIKEPSRYNEVVCQTSVVRILDSSPEEEIAGTWTTLLLVLKVEF